MSSKEDPTGPAPGIASMHILNPTDVDLQRRVMEALTDAVDGHAAHIGVTAHDGEVTLTGVVSTDTIRLSAHAAAARVWGLQSLADDLDIEGSDPSRTDKSSTMDTDLAVAAQRAISKVQGIPVDAVIVEVRDNIVTLTGEVSSAGERLAAEVAVTYLAGSPTIHNHIVATDRAD
jgi:osmotically-inducible protein OsmY